MCSYRHVFFTDRVLYLVVFHHLMNSTVCVCVLPVLNWNVVGHLFSDFVLFSLTSGGKMLHFSV